MKKILTAIFVTALSFSAYANDIYVTQSGDSLDLDITQDGSNNTVGNSTTASASAGATTILNIDQVGSSNVITYQIAGASDQLSLLDQTVQSFSLHDPEPRALAH